MSYLYLFHFRSRVYVRRQWGGANVVDSARSVRAAARRVRGRPLYVRPGYCVWRRARRREFIMAIIISVALARSAMSTRS